MNSVQRGLENGLSLKQVAEELGMTVEDAEVLAAQVPSFEELQPLARRVIADIMVRGDSDGVRLAAAKTVVEQVSEKKTTDKFLEYLDKMRRVTDANTQLLTA